jgi:hypothetical protein
LQQLGTTDEPPQNSGDRVLTAGMSTTCRQSCFLCFYHDFTGLGFCIKVLFETHDRYPRHCACAPHKLVLQLAEFPVSLSHATRTLSYPLGATLLQSSSWSCLNLIRDSALGIRACGASHYSIVLDANHDIWISKSVWQVQDT